MANENELNSDKSNIDLKNQIAELANEMSLYETEVEEYFDSTNFIFKSLFLDHETNKPKTLLYYLQELSLELLDFVNKVCKKHEISWWLDFGNLLGAVRHGGYVPWDDDVDIGMMREDYLRFDDIIIDEVKDHDLSDIIEVGYRPFRPGIPKFTQVYVRHAIDTSKGRKLVLGNVDVFPYEYIKEYDENTIVETYRDVKNQYLYHRAHDYNSRFCFDTYYESLNLSWEPTKYIIPGWENPCTPDDMYKLFVIETDKIFPLREIKFEDKIFPCPNDSDEYLSKEYNDYMNIPKAMRKHDNMGFFRYNTNNDEVFNKCLNKLKEVNKNFDY